MPKVSKVKTATSRPTSTLQDSRTGFVCARCGKHYPKQKGNFSAAQSALWEGNGKYLPVCYDCIDELYEHYKEVLESSEAAAKRVCLKFDLYWSPDAWELACSQSTSPSKMRSYISKINLIKWVGKTFDDTLDEEANAERIINTAEDVEDDGEIVVPKNVIRYWGKGFTPEMYLELEDRRAYWMEQFGDVTLSPGEEAILRQICNLEIQINRDVSAGNSIEKSTNALNTLLGSMNIKPSQKKDGEASWVPFGVEIARFEDEKPIIDEDKEFEDVDNIHKNVLTWFLGSLCKTAGIKNKYSQLFDEEVAKYTVERPEFDEDESPLVEGDDDEVEEI